MRAIAPMPTVVPSQMAAQVGEKPVLIPKSMCGMDHDEWRWALVIEAMSKQERPSHGITVSWRSVEVVVPWTQWTPSDDKKLIGIAFSRGAAWVKEWADDGNNKIMITKDDSASMLAGVRTNFPEACAADDTLDLQLAVIASLL